MKTPPKGLPSPAPLRSGIEPLEERIAPADTDVTLTGADATLALTITDITAGGSNDTLTISGGAAGLPFIITDPNSTLHFAVAQIPGAVLSNNDHTLTIPSILLDGPEFDATITVNTLNGDDTLTLDYTAGEFPNHVIYFGGNQVTGDRLIFKGNPLPFGNFTFTDSNSGESLFSTSNIGRVDFSLIEALDLDLNFGSLGLTYRFANQTINVNDAGGSKTTVTSTATLPVTFATPTVNLSVGTDNFDGDTVNVNSLPTSFHAALNIDTQAGNTDAINIAASLPALAGMTLTSTNISPLPALTIGAGGLSVLARAVAPAGIAVNGDLNVTGPLSLIAVGAITNPAGVVKAPTVFLQAAAGVTLTLDGGIVTGSNFTLNGITLTSVNNPTTLLSLTSGSGVTTLANGMFLVGQEDALNPEAALSLGAGATLNLNGFEQGVGFLSGTGTVTNTATALGTLVLGGVDMDSTFNGTITGHLAVEKFDYGTHILAGTNDYADGTTIRDGVLKFTGTGSAINGAFTLAGGTLAYGFGGTFSPEMNVIKNSVVTQNSTIDVGTGNVVTLTNPISGPGGLTKTGDGRLVLGSDLNTFGGPGNPLTITGGILEVATDGALGDFTANVLIKNATLRATQGFESGRLFEKGGGTATIEAQVPFLKFVNRAIVQGDFTFTNAGNMKFGYGTAPATTVVITANTTATISGNGTVSALIVGSTIESIELSGTDSTTKLIITSTGPGTVVNHIIIADPNPNDNVIASVGSIVLGPGVLLGNGVRDSVPEIEVEGRTGKLVLDDLSPYAYLDLGGGLPYDETDKTAPDTYNNRPNVTIHEVLGPGVLIDVTGDGTSGLTGGVGGGGLGKVVVTKWDYVGPAPATPDLPGTIRTTQGIGSFLLLEGDSSIVFEVDKFHNGTSSEAGVGSMTIQEGAWGSSGSVIEGGVGVFDADRFIALATLTCGKMGKFGLDDGAFAGLLTITDPDAAGIPTLTVNGHFAGTVDSMNAPIQKIKINGYFMGDLTASFIGSITAYGFLDTAMPGTNHKINATGGMTSTNGKLGTLTATQGLVHDLTIVTTDVFKGFVVKPATKMTADTAAIDNVSVQARSIGNITVTLAAATAPAGIDLIGIRNSQFVTTGNGAVKPDIGSIGNVTVTLTGAVGGTSAIGIQNSTFDALVSSSTVNPLGKITVKVTGQPGTSLGLDGATFKGNTIGATAITVTPATGALATAIDSADYTATGAIGALTISGNATGGAMVNDLTVSAGATVGAVTVKSTTLANGTLKDSAILAGQALDLNGTSTELVAALATANLGAVKVTGSILNSRFVAGGSLGAIFVGGALTGSLFLAGAKLGDDLAFGGTFDDADIYQRAASIAAITVKGAFGTTSIAAGVNPGDTVFGNNDDTAADDPNGIFIKASSIGAIALTALPALAHGTSTIPTQFAIEAAAIKSLKLGATPLPALTNALYLDTATPPTEDMNDVLVKLV